MSEEIAPEDFLCPLCGVSMQEGRAGMWLHYLEEGCDYVAALRRIQEFFAPLLNSDVWVDMGRSPEMDGDCTGVAVAPFRLHYRPGDPPPWSAVRHILNGGTLPPEGYASGCGCKSCNIIIQASERGLIKKHPWSESPRQWMDESPTAAQMVTLMEIEDARHKGVVASMQDRGKPLKQGDARWLVAE